MKYNHLTIILLLSLISAQKCFTQDKKNKILVNNPSDSVIVLNKNDTNSEHSSDCINILQILKKKSLVITEDDGIIIWKLKDGSVDTIIWFGDSTFVDKLAVTHDEDKVIASVNCYNGNKDFICCYSLSNKQLLWKAEDVKFDNGLGISMDDSLIYAIGSWNITTLNINTGTIVKKDRKFMGDYSLPQLRNLNVLFSPSGRYVLYWKSAEFRTYNLRIGSRLKVWDMVNNKKIASKYIYGRGVWSASFLPDEKSVLTGSVDGELRLWSIINNKIVKSWGIHNNHVGFKDLNCVFQTILPKEAEIFLGTYGLINGKWAFKIWQYPSMKEERILLYPGNCSAIFSNDGKLFIISNNGYLCLYETDSWKLLWRVLIRENKKAK